MHIYFYRAPKNIWILILTIVYFDYWVLLLYCDCLMPFSLRLCRGAIFLFFAVYFLQLFLWSKRTFDKLWQGWWFFILVSFVLISMSVFVCYCPSCFCSSILKRNFGSYFIFAFSLLFYGCLSFLILSLCNLQKHKANRSKILEMSMFQIIFQSCIEMEYFFDYCIHFIFSGCLSALYAIYYMSILQFLQIAVNCQTALLISSRNYIL